MGTGRDFTAQARATMREQLHRLAAKLLAEGSPRWATTLSPNSPSEGICALIERCQALGEWELAQQLIERFGLPLQGSQVAGRLDAVLRQMLEQDSLSPGLWVRCCGLHVRLLIRLGAHDQAQALLARGWAVAGEDERLHAELLNREGHLAESLHQFDVAVERYNKALALAEAFGDLTLQAMTLNNLGNARYFQERYEASRDAFQAALDLATMLGRPAHRARAAGGLGMALDGLKRFDEGRAFHLQAQDDYKLMDDGLGLVRIDLNLGFAALLRHELDEARHHTELALRGARALGDTHREATALHNLGRIATEEGDFREALDAFAEALERRRELGKPFFQQQTERHIGILVSAIKQAPDLAPEARQALLDGCDALLRESV